MNSTSDLGKKADMFLMEIKALIAAIAATGDRRQNLVEPIRAIIWRQVSLILESRLSTGERTTKPSELIHPSSMKTFQSESSMPIWQQLGGSMMLKKLQNSALERPNASQLSRQVLPPKNVMAIAPKVRQVFSVSRLAIGQLPGHKVRSDISSSAWSRRVRGAKRCKLAFWICELLRMETRVLASYGEIRIRWWTEAELQRANIQRGERRNSSCWFSSNLTKGIKG